MSRRHLLLGIDLGTSGVKAGIFTAEGNLLGLGRGAYSVDSPHPAWAETDPEKWWQGVCAALQGACVAAGIQPADIDAVGTSVLFPAIMPIDGSGRALHPAILYCDQRSVEQVQAIEKAVPRGEYQALTGNMLVPGNCAATMMLWLKDHAPDAYNGARVVGWANTFLAHRLTGSFVTDPSMVALSGLADIRDTSRWNERLCERLGIPPETLPEILPSSAVAGTICARAHAATGLRIGAPVICGCGDTPVSAFGAGARSPGDVVYSSGSTDCVTTPLSRPNRDLRWVNCAFAVSGMWCAIGTTTSSGVSVSWFCREILERQDDEARRALSDLASQSPVGANGLLFLPYLQGERTPIWDPRARGSFFGISAVTTRADMARAVLEGTAFGLRSVIESLELVAEKPVGEIRAVGGGTASRIWNSIKADALGRPLSVLGFQETGALGAALLAGIGTGIYRSVDEAARVSRSLGIAETVEPDKGRTKIYDELFRLFRDLYPSTKDTAHGLSERAM